MARSRTSIIGTLGGAAVLGTALLVAIPAAPAAAAVAPYYACQGPYDDRLCGSTKFYILENCQRNTREKNAREYLGGGWYCIGTENP